jgi:hypothetical protein
MEHLYLVAALVLFYVVFTAIFNFTGSVLLRVRLKTTRLLTQLNTCQVCINGFEMIDSMIFMAVLAGHGEP